ncbi:MAG: DUF1841 family protein [Acidobacteriota bacterium]|nr:MAG: DUF1841 family protein [Acidobacteriota bacterium]
MSPGMPNPQELEMIARAGREAMRRLWSRRDQRESMEAAELRLLRLLEMHPQYRAYWEGAEPDELENPFLHVMFHDMLDRQLRGADPPGVQAAYRRLLDGGADSHDALHEILREYARQLVRMTENRGPFDREQYVQRLERLGR